MGTELLELPLLSFFFLFSSLAIDTQKKIIRNRIIKSGHDRGILQIPQVSLVNRYKRSSLGSSVRIENWIYMMIVIFLYSIFILILDLLVFRKFLAEGKLTE